MTIKEISRIKTNYNISVWQYKFHSYKKYTKNSNLLRTISKDIPALDLENVSIYWYGIDDVANTFKDYSCTIGINRYFGGYQIESMYEYTLGTPTLPFMSSRNKRYNLKDRSRKLEYE